MKNRFRIECTKTRPHASTFSDVFRICFRLISNTLSRKLICLQLSNFFLMKKLEKVAVFLVGMVPTKTNFNQ
jgi:hypothetical protein